MVELIYVVAAYLSIELCIDVLNVFKVNCKSNGVTFFEVSLVLLLVNLDILWHGFGLVSLSDESFDSLISRRS